MEVKRGILKSFNSGNYTAVARLSGSDRVYIEGITVARNISSQEMTAGRELAIIFFDESNLKDSVVLGVFTR
ncbi:MAG: hypothetical protein JW712_04425 [Dehalococcoidales bacterium]|nr:hypothetical protein [Dehalococcoidales bacterium]